MKKFKQCSIIFVVFLCLINYSKQVEYFFPADLVRVQFPLLNGPKNHTIVANQISNLTDYNVYLQDYTCNFPFTGHHYVWPFVTIILFAFTILVVVTPQSFIMLVEYCQE